MNGSKTELQGHRLLLGDQQMEAVHLRVLYVYRRLPAKDRL